MSENKAGTLTGQQKVEWLAADTDMIDTSHGFLLLGDKVRDHLVVYLREAMRNLPSVKLMSRSSPNNSEGNKGGGGAMKLAFAIGCLFVLMGIYRKLNRVIVTPENQATAMPRKKADDS